MGRDEPGERKQHRPNRSRKEESDVSAKGNMLEKRSRCSVEEEEEKAFAFDVEGEGDKTGKGGGGWFAKDQPTDGAIELLVVVPDRLKRRPV
jgi:hypothetical protein